MTESILQLAESAFHEAKAIALKPSECRDDAKTENKSRSSNWVKALMQKLEASCQEFHENTKPVAFCKFNECNYSEHGINEFLFDILIGHSRPIYSVKGVKLEAIINLLWVVESELRVDSRAVLKDLNKLVFVRSKNIALVISQSEKLVAWTKERISELLDPSSCNIYLIAIPHPRDWMAADTGASRVSVDKFTKCGWLKL